MGRQDGYYWVRMFGDWMVAAWDGRYWFIAAAEISVYPDEIDERRLVRPDEVK